MSTSRLVEGRFFCLDKALDIKGMDYISQATQFVKEAVHELKLVSWLSRQQMIASTIIVLLFTLVMAAYVSVVDRVLLFFAQILFRIG